MDSEQAEWIDLFSRWPESEDEAHKRLLTRHGIPDIVIPVKHRETSEQLPLRTVLWKYLLLHKSSAFSNFYPVGVGDGKSRQSYYHVGYVTIGLFLMFCRNCTKNILLKIICRV